MQVLVIEDEPTIAENIVYALRTEGYMPVWKATGREGLETLKQSTISLIILDVGLPDCNGFDLCREIRKTSNIPVIFLTARSDDVDKVVGLEIGGDDYVVKPFSPRELAARVKAILRRSNERQAAVNKNSDARLPFVIDEERYTIVYHETSLDLSRYEFRILKILINRPGRIYSRKDLMNMAWEEPDTSQERTVDSHIKAIRSKLKEVKPDIDPVITHRGLGYSLTEEW